MTAAPCPAVPLPRRAAADLLPRRAGAEPDGQLDRLADYGLAGAPPAVTPAVLRSVLAGLGEHEACPGVLLVHADGRRECVESAQCPTDLALHAGSVRCADALDSCC